MCAALIPSLRILYPKWHQKSMDRLSNRQSLLCVRFYVEGLGFEMIHKWEPDGRLRWCWLQCGDAALMFRNFERKDAMRGCPKEKWAKASRLYSLLWRYAKSRRIRSRHCIERMDLYALKAIQNKAAIIHHSGHDHALGRSPKKPLSRSRCPNSGMATMSDCRGRSDSSNSYRLDHSLFERSIQRTTARVTNLR